MKVFALAYVAKEGQTELRLSEGRLFFVANNSELEKKFYLSNVDAKSASSGAPVVDTEGRVWGTIVGKLNAIERRRRRRN